MEINLWKNHKNKKRCSKKALGRMVLAILLLLLTACQKTPDIAVVVLKDSTTILAYLEGEPAPKEKYDAPTHWSVEEVRKQLRIRIDAEVSIPKVEAFPILGIESRPVEMAYAKKAAEYFLPGRELYELYPRTQDYYTPVILRCKQLLSLVQTNGDRGFGAMDLQVIDRLEETQRSAPQNVDKIATAYTFQTHEGGDLFSAKTEEDGTEYLLSIGNDVEFSLNNLFYAALSEKGAITGTLKDVRYGTIDVSLEQSTAHAEVALAALSLSEFQLFHQELGVRIPDDMLLTYPTIFMQDAFIQTAETGYVLYYAPSYAGIPKNVCFTDNLTVEETYAGIWHDEYIRLFVGKDGVEQMEWQNGKGTITQVYNGNIALVPFEEMKQRFIDQMFQSYGYLSFGDAERILEINKITLSYRKILMPNDPLSYLLIPAWDFYGREIIQYPNGYNGVSQDLVNENNQIVNDSFMHSFLTINAIDGAVINNIQGY